VVVRVASTRAVIVIILEISTSSASISSSSYYLSYQGGGDYRGIYDAGFKRGFYGVYRPFIE
jgi:hypothetical protein